MLPQSLPFAALWLSFWVLSNLDFMIPSRRLRLAVLFLVLGFAVGCDQTSKHMARMRLSQPGFVTVPGGIAELALADNPGSFLSLGAFFPKPLRLALFTVGIGAALILLFAYIVRHPKLDWASFVGLALVSAGGMSNLIDRITRHGFVTDFILIRVGPLHTGIFNLADVVIVTGVATLACGVGKRRRSFAN